MTDLQRARDLTHTVFDALWLHPRAIYDFAPTAKMDELREKMRARAECFIAEALGRPLVEIDQCEDIEELRCIYRACQHTNAGEIRDWFKARERAERRVERAAKKPKEKAEA